jgi:uncharacterized membrane protein
MNAAWPEIFIGRLLRVGVVLSICVVLVGMALTFAQHPEYFSPRPAGSHFSHSIREVVSGVLVGDGEAIVMAGLLLLIATPVARVALSIVVFVVERDRLYVMITTAVLLILLLGFATVAAG